MNPIHRMPQSRFASGSWGLSTLLSLAVLSSMPATAQSSVHASNARVTNPGRVYIAASAADSVSVIDATSNLVLRTIAVGDAPSRIAVSKDGSRAYVANTGSDSLSVIHTGTDTVERTIAVGDAPGALAVTPDGQRVYVLTAGGVVQAIDVWKSAVVASIPTGVSGGGLAITPDGLRVYVASGAVSLIDTTTNLVVRSFLPEVAPFADVSNSAIGVALSPDGARAYVSTVTFYFGASGFSGGGGVAIVDTATDAVIHMKGLGSVPSSSIAVTPDGGRAYVALSSNWVNTGYGAGFLPSPIVTGFDTQTYADAGWINVGKTAAGIAIAPDGSEVYATVPGLSSVSVIGTAANVVAGTFTVAASPSGLAFVPAAHSAAPMFRRP